MYSDGLLNSLKTFFKLPIPLKQYILEFQYKLTLRNHNAESILIYSDGLCQLRTEAFVKKNSINIGIFFPKSLTHDAMVFSCKYLNFLILSVAELAAIAVLLLILPSNSDSIIKVNNIGTINVIKKFMAASTNNELNRN